jgi:5-methylcytosine-specific restriction endonuclease McrA
MYYLDLFKLYQPTIKKDRISVREFATAYRNSDMEKLIKSQKGMCFWCPAQITMADHLDHLIPVYYGGRSNRTNLVAACKSCNLFKSTQQIEITNPYTIARYQSMIAKKAKWDAKVAVKPSLARYRPKEVHIYNRYHAECFKEA